MSLEYLCIYLDLDSLLQNFKFSSYRPYTCFVRFIPKYFCRQHIVRSNLFNLLDNLFQLAYFDHSLLKSDLQGNSLMVQWLGLCTSIAGNPDLIPSWRTRVPKAVWHRQIKTLINKMTIGIDRLTYTTSVTLFFFPCFCFPLFTCFSGFTWAFYMILFYLLS